MAARHALTTRSALAGRPYEDALEERLIALARPLGAKVTRCSDTLGTARTRAGDMTISIAPAAVRDLTSTRTEMRIQASAGSWTCDAVLVAAGIDTPRLAAQVGVSLPTLLARHARFTFAVRDPQPERLACWIDASGAYGAGLSSYGQPVGTSGRYAVGVSEQDANYPATMAVEEVSRRAREVAERYIQAALPGLDPQPEAELQCVSNRTGFADGDGFGAVQRGTVTVVYGNNLFKFAPLLGGDLLAHTSPLRVRWGCVTGVTGA
jgi:sarcosine oxidase